MKTDEQDFIANAVRELEWLDLHGDEWGYAAWAESYGRYLITLAKKGAEYT